MITKKEGAVFDGNQDEVIARIEPFTTGMDLTATRGHSSALDQLATIEKFAGEHKVHFPEFKHGVLDELIDIPGVGKVYLWQRTHSRLLVLGVVVNPPRPCRILENYIRPTGEKMLGKIMQASTHITGESDGMWPIDFSSRVNGVPNLALVNNILTRAKAAGAGIEFIRLEPGNGCAHVGTLKVIA
jgi:hypothetical protein